MKTQFEDINNYLKVLINSGFVDSVTLLHALFVGEEIPKAKEGFTHTENVLSALERVYDFEHMMYKESSDYGEGVFRIGDTYYHSKWGKDWEGAYISYEQVYENISIVKPKTEVITTYV